MPKEIERKYRLKNDDWKAQISAQKHIQQAYLNTASERTVRVRVQNQEGRLTIKGKSVGITRAEYEYAIPYEEALELLQLCEQAPIIKTRFIVLFAGAKWEIDIFEGQNVGLEIAEVELQSEDQAIQLPDWIGEEITQDKRYSNSNLSLNPYENWKTEA